MVGERPVQQLVALLPDARRERLVHVDDVAAACRTTATRCEIESNVFSSSRRDRMTSSSSCMFSTALES